MKKILVSLVVLAMTHIASSQENGILRTEYLQKSKRQSTLAWCMLGTGFATTTAGVIIETNQLRQSIRSFDGHIPKDQVLGESLIISGGVILFSSIPIFIASSKNKMRAATAFLKMESRQVVYESSFTKKSYPALGLKVSL